MSIARARLVRLTLISAAALAAACSNARSGREAPTPDAGALTYDEAADMTTLSSEHLSIVTVPRVPIEMWVTTSFRGRTAPAEAPRLQLLFRSTNRRAQFQESRELALVTDARRIDLPGTTQRADVGPFDVTEVVGTPVSSELLRELAAAPSVSGRLGRVDFRLPANGASVLRDFLARRDSLGAR